MAETTPTVQVSLPNAVESAAAKVTGYLQKSKAPNTLRAYESDVRHFRAWCDAHGLAAFPAEPATVSMYVADQAESLKVSTIERRLNAIAYDHRSNGIEVPTIHPGLRETMKGIRREHGSARHGKAPFSAAQIRQIVSHLPDSMSGIRDRAIILLGFAGALRRSELAALQVEDLQTAPEGLVVTVRRSKTDQAGEGQEVGIARGSYSETCPVSAVETWLKKSGVTPGALFRPVDRNGKVRASGLTGYSIALIVKRAARRANVPVASGDIGAHSLRAGHATEAAREGAAERSIMKQGRWISERTVRSYIRHGSLFTENSSKQLGL